MVCGNQNTERGSRIALVLIVMTGLLATAFPSGAQEDTQEWPETIIGFGERPSDHEGGFEAFECEDEQLALVVADLPGCGDFGGDHVRNGWYMSMGFRSTNAGNYGPVPLTGQLEAKLTWGNRESVFVCEWADGEFVGCLIGIFKWPNIGETFEFACQSRDGAIGGWSECFMEHG